MASSSYDLSGRGTADIVDAQLHLSLELGIDETLAAMDALGIASVMLDEVWARLDKGWSSPCVEFADGGYRPVSPYAQAAALRFPDRFSYLQRLRRHDPQLAAWMAVLASSTGCRAVRIVLFEPQERAAFLAGDYDELLGLAQRHALPICVCAVDLGSLLPGAAGRFPDLQFVVDHAGWTKGPQQWADVLALARHRNTWLKWAHASRAFDRSGSEGDKTQAAFLQALEAYGPDRVMWAGDVTHEESSASWSRLLHFVLDNPALSPGDRDWVLARTARRAFRWEAKAAMTAVPRA